MTTSESEPVFTEAEAKRIIARAIELDDRARALLSTADLRAIADGVGVSPAALQAAIDQLQPEPPPPAVNPWRVPVFLTVAGISLGMVTAAAYVQIFVNRSFAGVFAGPVITATMLISAALVWQAGKGKQSTFQKVNLFHWLGRSLGFAFGLTIYRILSERPDSFGLLLGWSLQYWLVCSVLGGVAIHFRNARRLHDDSSSDTRPGWFARVRTAGRRLLARIRQSLHSLFLTRREA